LPFRSTFPASDTGISSYSTEVRAVVVGNLAVAASEQRLTCDWRRISIDSECDWRSA
jgi:hypothetical protein